MTVPAQMAAMFDKRIEGVYLSGGLSSFRSIVDRESYNVPFGNFIPRILEWGDLGDVTAAIRPRRIVTAGMVDGGGRTAQSDLPQARWDVDTLDNVVKNMG